MLWLMCYDIVAMVRLDIPTRYHIYRESMHDVVEASVEADYQTSRTMDEVYYPSKLLGLWMKQVIET